MAGSDGSVAVVGASGKTGRAVSGALRARGRPVRPVGRADWSELPAALAGCSSLYVIAPNMYPDEPAFVAQVLDAATAAGIVRVVYHSVAAPFAPSMPHHVGKAHAEDVVRRSGLAWTILQPCAYVQNFLPGVSATPPAVRVPYDLDRPFGLVDLVDVGEAAAVVLVEDDHAGATYELGGPRLVSCRDVARAAEQVLGRDVEVARVDVGEWVSGPGERLRSQERDWLLAMFDYYDRHGLPAGSLAARALLGREPLGLEATLARELGPRTLR